MNSRGKSPAPIESTKVMSASAENDSALVIRRRGGPSAGLRLDPEIVVEDHVDEFSEKITELITEARTLGRTSHCRRDVHCTRGRSTADRVEKIPITYAARMRD